MKDDPAEVLIAGPKIIPRPPAKKAKTAERGLV
jgi:hypothetical protein